MKTISKTTHHINFDIFIFVMRSIKNFYFLFSLVTFFFFFLIFKNLIVIKMKYVIKI
jgi:hypothetical protein